jgi:hypothetical protein
MATSKYTIAPPTVAPLLMEYGEFDLIPEDAWREYIAAQAYWARTWLMYADPPKRNRRARAASHAAAGIAQSEST